MTAVVDNLWQMASMLSVLASIRPLERDLADGLRQIQHDVNVLVSSMRDHCVNLTTFERADASSQSDYQLRLLTGQFVQQIIRHMFEDSEVVLQITCRFEEVARHTSLPIKSLALSPGNGCSMSMDDFERWQRLLSWWVHWENASETRETIRYFHYLKRVDWVHMDRWAIHCTCERDFIRMFHNIFRLVRTLRCASFEYDLNFGPHLMRANHVVTQYELPGQSDCVLPSLKVRQRDGLWETVYNGCGIISDKSWPAAPMSTRT